MQALFCNAVPAPLKQPLTFQHVAGWESSGASKTNPKQADAAVALIQLLVKASEVCADKSAMTHAVSPMT